MNRFLRTISLVVTTIWVVLRTRVLRRLSDIAINRKTDFVRVRAYELRKVFSTFGDQFGANVENKGGQVVFYMPVDGR